MSREYFFERYKSFGQKPQEIETTSSLRMHSHDEKDHEAVIKKLEARGIRLKKIPFLKNGYWITSKKVSPGATMEYLLGDYYIQEAASQIPVEELFQEPAKQGEIILDACAAPGGKTTHIASYTDSKNIPVVAVEKLGDRCYPIKNHCERMGIHHVVVYKKDARYLKELNCKFDRILVDAPCSGNFVVDYQWFGKRSEEMFLERQRRQKEILKSAFSVLKPGGTLVYSTCSIEPEEDEFVVDWVLKKYEDIRIVPLACKIGDEGMTQALGKELDKDVRLSRRFWPWKTNTQGFFIAKFVKGGEE